jgi:hypothetical protein
MVYFWRYRWMVLGLIVASLKLTYWKVVSSENVTCSSHSLSNSCICDRQNFSICESSALWSRATSSLPCQQALLLLDDVLYHPHRDVAQFANFVSELPGDLGWELMHIKPQSVLHANVSFTLGARPLSGKVLHCGLVGDSFLKQRYALLSNSSRIVSNLAGDFDPSCVK